MIPAGLFPLASVHTKTVSPVSGSIDSISVYPIREPSFLSLRSAAMSTVYSPVSGLCTIISERVVPPKRPDIREASPSNVPKSASIATSPIEFSITSKRFPSLFATELRIPPRSSGATSSITVGASGSAHTI